MKIYCNLAEQELIQGTGTAFWLFVKSDIGFLISTKSQVKSHIRVYVKVITYDRMVSLEHSQALTQY